MTKVGNLVHDMLQQGGVLVHCRNGNHRAPAIMAYHLRLEGWDEAAIIKAVGWTELVKNPGAYKKYVDWALGR